MEKRKTYAVVKGRRPGIYNEWFGACGAEVQIKGFAGAVFKGFTSRREAEAWFAEISAGTLPGQKPQDSAGEGGRSQVRRQVLQKKVSELPKQRRIESGQPEAVASGADVVLYTDGGCSKNPGSGGYGVVLFHDGIRRELSGGYALTTNNRMELIGCIKGLEALEKQCSVIIHSDSQYVVNGIEKGWALRWRKNNWKRNATDMAENSDLWSRLLDLCEKHDVKFVWVRGHNGNPENERCDALAVEMTRRKDLPLDHGYTGKSGSMK